MQCHGNSRPQIRLTFEDTFGHNVHTIKQNPEMCLYHSWSSTEGPVWYLWFGHAVWSSDFPNDDANRSYSRTPKQVHLLDVVTTN